MLTRHTNELMSRLEQVVDIGCCTIRKNELLIWFDQDRVTVNIWRDLQDKWDEILETQEEKPDIPLLVGDAEGVWTFVWGEGLVASAKDDPWFKNVRDLGKREPQPQQAPASEEKTSILAGLPGARKRA
jgi:hypothetical protein